MECAQVTEEQRLWTETQIQKAKLNAWPSCLASVYLTQSVIRAHHRGNLCDWGCGHPAMRTRSTWVAISVACLTVLDVCVGLVARGASEVC